MHVPREIPGNSFDAFRCKFSIFCLLDDFGLNSDSNSIFDVLFHSCHK